jgi:hypothetical protein
MNTFISNRFLLLFSCLLCATLLRAGQITVEVTQRYSALINSVWERNPNGGGIEDALKALNLSNEDIQSITDLKVLTAAGIYIEPADLAFLHALPLLEKLDLSEAVSTSMVNRTDNGLPRDAFSGNASIKTIVFPNNLTGFPRGLFANSALEGIINIPAGIATVAEYEMSFGGSRGITVVQGIAKGQTLPLEKLDRGIYILQTANGTTQKIIIQK